MIYDSKTDVWREGTVGSRGIHFGFAVATTGVYAPQRVYVMGLTSGGDFASLTNRVYNPETGVWSAANAMPTLRKGFGVAVVDDILYVRVFTFREICRVMILREGKWSKNNGKIQKSLARKKSAETANS